MSTKKPDKKPLHVDGVCFFELPIEVLEDPSANSVKIAAHAVAMAALVARFPSLSFTVNADGIEATIDACALINDISLEALIRGILEAGETQHREYIAWKQREAKLERVKQGAKKVAA